MCSSKPRLLVLMLLGLPCLLGGCAIFGVAARAFPNNVPAAYTGLKGKQVAVMVWVDRSISVDWPTMSIDLTAGVQHALEAAIKTDHPDDLKDTTFPVTAQSMANFQLDHPEARFMPIAQVVPQVGVQRLIYIEVVNFQTHSDMAVNTELYRGQISANIKVLEYENGQVKVGYEENGVTAKFPKDAPTDGVINLGDPRTYVGTMETFSTVVAQRFYKHEEQQE